MATETEAVHSSLQPNGERERERESICTTDSERSMRVQTEAQLPTGKSNRNRMPSCKLLTYGALRRMMHRFEVNLKKKKAYQRKQALSKTSRQSRLERELQRKKQEAEDKRKMVMSMLAQAGQGDGKGDEVDLAASRAIAEAEEQIRFEEEKLREEEEEDKEKRRREEFLKELRRKKQEADDQRRLVTSVLAQAGQGRVAASEDSDAIMYSTASVRANTAYARLASAYEARAKNNGIIPEHLLRMLSRQPKDRSPLDIDALLPLLRASSWLDEVPPHVLAIDGALRAITSAIRFRYIGEAQALVTAGDLMQGMYVVQGGSVLQFIRQDCRRIPHPVTPVLYSGQTAGRLRKPEGDGSFAPHTHTHTNQRDESAVESLGEHLLFCECDLIAGDQGAALLQIDRFAFESALQPFIDALVTERALFLKNIFPFSAMDNAERHHLARQVRELHVPSNTLVIRQGAVANDFFVIYSGSVRVIKQLDVYARDLLQRPGSVAPQDPAKKCLRIFGQHHSNFRNPFWRELLPQHRHLLQASATLHPSPFKVPKLPVDRIKSDRFVATNALSFLEKKENILGKKEKKKTSDSSSSAPVTSAASARESREKAFCGGSPPRTRARISARTAVRASSATSPRASYDTLRNAKTAQQGQDSDELGGAKKVILQLREMWRGQYFGELAIINKTTRTASVVTNSSCRLLVLSKFLFQKLGLDNGEGAAQILEAQDEQRFTNDDDDLAALMQDDFRWTTVRNNIVADSALGSNSGLTKRFTPPIVCQAKTLFSE